MSKSAWLASWLVLCSLVAGCDSPKSTATASSSSPDERTFPSPFLTEFGLTRDCLIGEPINFLCNVTAGRRSNGDDPSYFVRFNLRLSRHEISAESARSLIQFYEDHSSDEKSAAEVVQSAYVGLHLSPQLYFEREIVSGAWYVGYDGEYVALQDSKAFFAAVAAALEDIESLEGASYSSRL